MTCRTVLPPRYELVRVKENRGLGYCNSYSSKCAWNDQSALDSKTLTHFIFGVKYLAQ